jgi:hypothetical protein
VGDEDRTIEALRHVSGDLVEGRGVLELTRRDAVYVGWTNVAARIDQRRVLVGRFPVGVDSNNSYFDNAVMQARREAGRLDVDNREGGGIGGAQDLLAAERRGQGVRHCRPASRTIQGLTGIRSMD